MARDDLAHEVTTEATDNRSLLPMAKKARGAVDAEELHVVADASYSNGEQAGACEGLGIVTHVPANRSGSSQGDGTLYDHGRFTYDEATDTMRCPADQILKRKQFHRQAHGVLCRRSFGVWCL